MGPPPLQHKLQVAPWAHPPQGHHSFQCVQVRGSQHKTPQCP